MLSCRQLNGPVLVRVTSDSDTCATISVQSDMCPIHDLMYDIEYDGIFQSMTRLAAITVTPGFSSSGQVSVLLFYNSSLASLNNRYLLN